MELHRTPGGYRTEILRELEAGKKQAEKDRRATSATSKPNTKSGTLGKFKREGDETIGGKGGG